MRLPSPEPGERATSVLTATVSPVSSARLPSRTPRSRTPDAAGVRIIAEPASTTGSPNCLYSRMTVVSLTGAAASTPEALVTAARVPAGRPPRPGAVRRCWARVPVRVSCAVALMTVVWARV